MDRQRKSMQCIRQSDAEAQQNHLFTTRKKWNRLEEVIDWEGGINHPIAKASSIN